jgi:hypothetical protein
MEEGSTELSLQLSLEDRFFSLNLIMNPMEGSIVAERFAFVAEFFTLLLQFACLPSSRFKGED